jgi:HK97 family phage major capsid protein
MSHVIENIAGNENVGGSAAGLVQFGNISGAPTMAILGRPLIITEKAQALNTQADLSFIDFSHYLVGDRQAISIDSSEHSRFMNDETELRIIERVDGRPWLQSAITPKNGTATLSPYVVLAAG